MKTKITIPTHLNSNDVTSLSKSSNGDIENNFTKIKILKIFKQPCYAVVNVKVLLNDKIETIFQYDFLEKLFLNSTIINGEVNCTCKVVFWNSQAILIDVNDDNYKKWEMQTRYKPYIHQNIIGDIFTQDSIDYFVFLGAVSYQRDNPKFDYQDNFIKNEISYCEGFLLLKIKQKDFGKKFESLYKNKPLIIGNYTFSTFHQDDYCMKMDVPEDYKKIIADYYYNKANNTLSKAVNKEYKISFISKIIDDISLANINGGTKTISDVMIFQ